MGAFNTILAAKAGIRTSLREVRASKLRSALTVVGIAIGVATVVSAIGVVQGSFAAWRSYIEAYGGLERVTLQTQPLPRWQQARAAQQVGMRALDVVKLKADLHGRAIISPEINLGTTKVIVGDREYNAFALGVEERYIAMNRIAIYAGRGISALDVQRTARVAVIGSEVAEAVFGTNRDVVGRQIDVQGDKFTVIGLCGARNLSAGRGWDVADKARLCLLPLTTVQKNFGWQDFLSGVSINVNSREEVEHEAARIRRLVGFYHNGLRDIAVHTKTREIENWRRTERGTQFALAMIASISLLVAGIGIMNVMFASINERTREIGVRRALGASRLHIGAQFLTEAVVIAVIGGALGVLAGQLMIPLLGKIMPDEVPGRPILVMSSVWLGLGFSVMVGLIAGIMPALRAVRLDPLEALRRE